MRQLVGIDAAEIAGWLTRLTQTIDRNLRDGSRAEAIGALRSGLEGSGAGLHVLAQLALLDDCLRVADLVTDRAAGEIDAAVLARVAELVAVAAPKYFAVLPAYESFDEGADSAVDVARFVRVHRADAGPFGLGDPTPWRGISLVRRVANQTRNGAAMRDHERMLARILDDLFAGRSTTAEDAARSTLRGLFEAPVVTGVDPRVAVFCRADGPEVFSSVAHGSQIHERDPFDVEAIHAEARDVFHHQIQRASTPAQHQFGHGRTMLVLGTAGSGKTHLMRALRNQVHAQRIGYVGYMQMTSEVGDYGRYVLRNLIDSMERPYDAPDLQESALMYLSDGIAEGRGEIPVADRERLRSATLDDDELASLIGGMVDRLVRVEGLGGLESDLVHALLLLQRRDPAIQRRIVRFLRCESLTAHEQRLLGGLAPRLHPEDPMRMIEQLGKLAYELQSAALVVLVDQVEDAVPDGSSVTQIQQAIDVLRKIADAVPSAVIVIACLEDVYDQLRPRLTQSVIDRLERDPAPVRLANERKRDEIEAMLVRRLDYLYSAFDVAWRDDEPLFPFRAAQVDALANQRARDCLVAFRAFREACIAGGGIVDAQARSAPLRVEPATTARAQLDRAWNDAVVATTDVPDDDEGVMALVAEAILSVGHELGIELDVHRERTRITFDAKALGLHPRVIEACNHSAQGGHLGNQLEALRGRAPAGHVPVAIRSSDFAFKAKTRIAQQIGEFVAAGGRTIVIDVTELRAVVAAGALSRSPPPGFEAWRRRRRPLAELRFVRELLDLDRNESRAGAGQGEKPAAPVRPVRAAAPSGRVPVVAPVTKSDESQLRIGITTSIRGEPVTLDLEDVRTHVAFLGTTGSGKTTAALLVIEQLLERGVSVLMVDRKGDLARYASPAWWQQPPASPADATRKRALRERVDVALFTPGCAAGRPIRLPIVPAGLFDATDQERDQIAKFAASGLAAMMGYGRSATQRHRESVLKRAIELHADEREVTVEQLCETIKRPDPQLLAAVGALTRHFAPLAEDLESLNIQHGALLGGHGEALDVAALLPPRGARARLVIVNTSAMTNVAVLQFWVSRLLIELGRMVKKRPASTLQAAVFFDEADIYIPATSAPATKEPMFDLLRRARSGGLGVMLASQNPGDFDYKARDNIGTWLVGKVAQDRAIEKMRNLLANYPNVGARLANQSAGDFFVLAGRAQREIHAARSLMTTEQMSEHEVVELARSQRPPV